MIGYYEPAFEREMGCSVADMWRWLPGALRGRPLSPFEDGVDVAVGSGHLRIRWQLLAPRRLGLVRFERMRVQFAFEAVPEDERQTLMRYFDLYTQRGGG
jgi:hypothetical protein